MKRLFSVLLVVGMAWNATPARSELIGGSPAVLFVKDAQVKNRITHVVVDDLESFKGILNASRTERFLLEIGVAFIDPQTNNRVANPKPSDSGAEAEEPDGVRRNAPVTLKPAVRAIPSGDADTVKKFLDGGNPLLCEVTVSLVLVDGSGGRHYLDTILLTDVIESDVCSGKSGACTIDSECCEGLSCIQGACQ